MILRKVSPTVTAHTFSASKCSGFSFSSPKLRSLWPAPRIESSGRVRIRLTTSSALNEERPIKKSQETAGLEFCLDLILVPRAYDLFGQRWDRRALVSAITGCREIHDIR